MVNYIDWIRFICDLLTIEIPDIHLKQNDSFRNLFGENVQPFLLNKSAIATTYPEQRVIKIDLDRVKNDMDLYIILAHEIRHIYQYIALYQDDELNQELSSEEIKVWDKELKTYKNSLDSTYVEQEIEIDAIAFSYIVCRAIFNIAVKSDCNQTKLAKRIVILANNYTQDEILECARYIGIQPRKILA